MAKVNEVPELRPITPQPGDEFVRYDPVNKVSIYKRGNNYFKVSADNETHLVRSLAKSVNDLASDVNRWLTIAGVVGGMDDRTERLQTLLAKSDESYELIEKLHDIIIKACDDIK